MANDAAAGDTAPESEAKGQTKSPKAPPVTLITGATEGIGYALTREFARAGHTIVMVARSESNLQKRADELCAEFSITVHAQAADLATNAGCQRVADAVRRAGVQIDYLVNNAGIASGAFFHESDRNDLLRQVDVNMRAVTDLTWQFLPGMIERGFGGVLNVSSLGAFVPGPNMAVYYASKAYVMSLTEALAYENDAEDVKIAVLAPGPVATEFHERAGMQHRFYMYLMGAMSPETVARIAYTNFMCGQQIIVPGLMTIISAAALRVAPHFLTVPFTGWLLRERENPGRPGTWGVLVNWLSRPAGRKGNSKTKGGDEG